MPLWSCGMGCQIARSGGRVALVWCVATISLTETDCLEWSIPNFGQPGDHRCSISASSKKDSLIYTAILDEICTFRTGFWWFFRFSSRGGGSTCLPTFILCTVMIQYHKKQKNYCFWKNIIFNLEIQLPPCRLPGARLAPKTSKFHVRASCGSSLHPRALKIF